MVTYLFKVLTSFIIFFFHTLEDVAYKRVLHAFASEPTKEDGVSYCYNFEIVALSRV